MGRYFRYPRPGLHKGTQLIAGKGRRGAAPASPHKKYYLFLLVDDAVITFTFVRFGPFIRLIVLFRDLGEAILCVQVKKAERKAIE